MNECLNRGFSRKSSHFVEFQFAPLVGGLKQIEVIGEEYLSAVNHGKGFDASSVRLAPVEYSDRLLKPIKEWNSYAKIPWEPDTASILCDIFCYAESVSDFGQEKEYELSPRKVLKDALRKAREMGYGFKTSVEKEFFLLLEKNGKLVPSDYAPYFASPPLDKGYHVRREIVRTLSSHFNIDCEYSHHEVAPGQHEISLRVRDALEMADKVLRFEYVAENLVASKLWPIDGADTKLIFTTMPKVFPDQNGSGQHIHISLSDVKTGANLFVPEDRGQLLSDLGKYFLGGILNNADGLALLLAPTVNSYKRLRPGFEAPVAKKPGYAWWNRTMLIRVPGTSSESSIRIEVRMADARMQPHLAFAGILYAGLQGIEEKIDPGEPANKVNVFRLPSGQVEFIPGNLGEAIDAFRKNNTLRKGLGDQVVSEYARLKQNEWDEFTRENEWNPDEITSWEIERYLFAFNVNYRG